MQVVAACRLLMCEAWPRPVREIRERLVGFLDRFVFGWFLFCFVLFSFSFFLPFSVDVW